MPYPQQTDEQRRKMLAQELSHRGSGYIPTQEEINTAIDVGMGRKSADIAYGEEGLRGGAEIGSVGGVPVSMTDVVPGASMAKLAAMLKVGGTGLAALGGGMGVMSKMGAGSVPQRFGQSGRILDIPPPKWNKGRQSMPIADWTAQEKPSMSEIKELLKDDQARSAYNTLRTLKNANTGKIEYAWPADAALHQDVGNFLKLNPQDYEHGLIAP